MATKPLSQHNGFTLGFKGEPHGYVRGVEAKPGPVYRSPRAKAGFGVNNGTINGMAPFAPPTPWAKQTTAVERFKK